MAQRRLAFRDLTRQFHTDFLDNVQTLIDRGQGAIRLATDGHSIRVFVRRAPDFVIGGIYDVPSGLGGRFRVVLKDACDTFATVQNCGNSAFWGYEGDEVAPMSRERAARQGIGATTRSHKRCEDFDAMQPYRVPLDALMEFEDRTAA